MKKWIQRSVVILVLGAAGTLGFALRPAFVPDSSTRILETDPKTHKPLPWGCYDTQPGAREREARFDLRYTWDLLSHPTGTAVLGDLEPDAFSLLREARWTLGMHVADGKVRLEEDTPVFHAKDPLSAVETRFVYVPDCTTVQRMPDGQSHFQHHFSLICEVTVTRTFWRKPIRSVAVQEMVVDYVDGCADLLATPYLGNSLRGKPLSALPVKLVAHGSPTGLPERYCGSTAQKELTRLVYALANIGTKLSADRYGQYFSQEGEALLALRPEPDKAWPECWGGDADEVRKLARRLAPVLQRLQERNCFESQVLADFLASPLLRRLFGEEATTPGEDLPEVQPVESFVPTVLPDEPEAAATTPATPATDEPAADEPAADAPAADEAEGDASAPAESE